MNFMSATLSALQQMPIAIDTDETNSQLYELPTAFFKLVLGNKLNFRYLKKKMLTLKN